MKAIPLNGKNACGLFALVDDEDFDELSKYSWHARKDRHTSYARRTVYIGGKGEIRNNKIETMHRIILKAKKGEFVDHIDGNGLNNQRSNLRICTNAQNKRNQRKSASASSRYKGIHWNIDTNKWRAVISANKKRVELGLFVSEIDAAKAYDVAALKYHGEFANLNFPQAP